MDGVAVRLLAATATLPAAAARGKGVSDQAVRTAPPSPTVRGVDTIVCARANSLAEGQDTTLGYTQQDTASSRQQPRVAVYNKEQP